MSKGSFGGGSVNSEGGWGDYNRMVRTVAAVDGTRLESNGELIGDTNVFNMLYANQQKWRKT
jgi:hypothetical protein